MTSGAHSAVESQLLALPGRRARRYLDVVVTLTQRELRNRTLAGGWVSALAVPAAFLAVYGFVFSTLIPVELRPGAQRADYVYFLFAGLVLWNAIADALGRAPTLYVQNASLLRKAEFPASALALANAAAPFALALGWLAVFALARVALADGVGPAFALAPITLAIACAGAAGASLVLASFGVLVRQTREWTPPLLTLMLFLSPVLFPADRLASLHPWLVSANPIAQHLALLRTQLLEGGAGSLELWLGAAAWSAFALAVGLAVQRRTRAAVADLAG